ncbi:hypothetical protein F4808DRAFT_437454 [Astrocystis sublimbata]|nr:hypothetical protein F4808DRAFT_437454 [Astrocystis sublimbata]
MDVLESEKLEDRRTIRQFTDQLAGANELERLTKAAQAERDEIQEEEERKRMRLLYEDLDENDSPLSADFDVAESAREALRRTIEEFNDRTRPSVLQRVGISSKSKTTVSIAGLETTMHLDEVKSFVQRLETSWKESHGTVYDAFKKTCGTLDGHKSLLALFPSETMYTSVLAGGLTCLVKAAKNHGDIAETLSKAVANISDKVATCSPVIHVIKTRRLRKKLAHIYARMFQFYQDAIKWYLQSRLLRAFSSFNDNIKKGFTDTINDLEDCIREVYRETAVGGVGMLATLNNNLLDITAELQRQRQSFRQEQEDHWAGHRMLALLEDICMSINIGSKGKMASTEFGGRLVAGTNRIEELGSLGTTRAQARIHKDAIKAFIIGEEGPDLSNARSSSYVAEDGVLHKLRTWMPHGTESSTLWISSPYEVSATTSARAAALAVVTAAWGTQSPIISHFCQRMRPNKVRNGMSIEQVGLIGVVYSLIHQLLEFGKDTDEVNINTESLALLDGRVESWDASLEVLASLLEQTPNQMHCVIDGVSDLEFGDGKQWCRQFLEVLFARQGREGKIFSILLTTSGQSMILPSLVQMKDKHHATRPAREVARHGKRLDLNMSQPGGPSNLK